MHELTDNPEPVIWPGMLAAAAITGLLTVSLLLLFVMR